MGNSWMKRNSNRDIHDPGYKAYWKRYDEWKSHWLDRKGNWKEVPLKFGDSWNAKLGCWNNEIYRGERDPETGELIEEAD